MCLYPVLELPAAPSLGARCGAMGVPGENWEHLGAGGRHRVGAEEMTGNEVVWMGAPPLER